MANDKVTYNEELERLQKTQNGRVEIENFKQAIVNPQYRQTRKYQLVKMYNKYMDERCSSVKSFWPGQETSQDSIRKMLGDGIIAVDTLDAQIVRQLAEMAQGRLNKMDVAFVAEEIRAVKSIIEGKYQGVSIRLDEFCRDTDVLLNANKIAEMEFYSQMGYPDTCSMPVEFWGKVGYGQPYNLNDLLPRDIPPKSFFDSLGKMLQALVNEKTMGNRTIVNDSYQK